MFTFNLVNKIQYIFFLLNNNNICLFTEKGYNLQRKGIFLKERASIVFKAINSSTNWKNVKNDMYMNIYPIVRAQSQLTNMKCTFSFITGIDVEIAKRIQEYLATYPICK